MFGDGKTKCPVCDRWYAHLTTCGVPRLHEDLEERLIAALEKGYTVDDLMVEVVDRHAQ